MAAPGRPVTSGATAPTARYGHLSFGRQNRMEAWRAAWRLSSAVLVATLATMGVITLSPLAGLGVGSGRSAGNTPGVTPAASAESPTTISANPSSGRVGSNVTVSGGGFSDNAPLTIYFDATSGYSGPLLPSCTTGETGSFSCVVQVPPLTAGAYYLNVTDGVNKGSTSYTILSPTLTLSPSVGVVSSNSTVVGSGFYPAHTITLTFNRTSVTNCVLGTSLIVNPWGNFSCTFAVPPSTAGRQTVSATDSVNTASGTFDVTANLSLSQPSGSFGEVVGATGTGLDPDASVSVAWNSSYELCGAETDAAGSFSCSFAVPTAPAGSYTITASDGPNAPTAAFQVDPTVFLSSTSRVVGQPEIANGYGFDAFLSISILWDHLIPECSGSLTNSNGAVTCAFLVPATPGGEHNVSFVQGAVELNRSLTVSAAFSIDPNSGVVGLNVQLIGTGFQASTTYWACLEASLASCPSGSTFFSTATNGSIPTDAYFMIPEEPPGSYDLVVSTSTMIVGEASFVVTTATVDLTPISGPVGSVVSLSGSGFAPDSIYAYCFQATAVSCPSETTEFTTTVSGDVPSGLPPLTVPASPAGTYRVDVSQGTILVGSGEFTLLANVTANVTSVTVGSSVLAVGTGYPALTSYVVAWNSSVSLCAGTTNSAGGFTCSFAVPPASKGAHEVSATAGSSLASFTLLVLPTLVVSPATGTDGSIVRATGTGFDADTAYSVLWNSSALLCSKWTNASGSLACLIVVPSSPAGPQNISIVEASTTVTVKFVVVPSLVEAPSYGEVGSVARVTGAGFDARSPYIVIWDSSTSLCTGITNVTGGLACAFPVPVAPGGPNTIETGEGPYSLTVVFTVTPSVVISPPEGPVGARVAAVGMGFAAGAAYSFRWNSSASLCNGSATSSGAVACDFTVPAAPAGTYNITAIEGGSSVAVQFTILPSFVISLETGDVGSAVRMFGGGFDADSSFTLAWNSTTQLCSGTTTGNGNLSCAFLVPNAPGGSHPLVLSEGSHSLTTSFTVSASVSISQLNATPGTSVTVVGEGFVPGEPYVVSLTPSGGTLCTGTPNANGAFVCPFVVPSVPPGQYVTTITQGPAAVYITFFVAPPPPSPSSTPFPWWLVAVVVVAALVGALVIYVQFRRQSTARRRTDRISKGSAVPSRGSGGTGGSLPVVPRVGPSPGSNAALAATASEDDAAMKLFRRLVPIYREVLKAPLPPGAYRFEALETLSAKKEVDALVARLGPIYQDALRGSVPPGSYAGTVSRTPASAEEVRAYIAHLLPVYRTILKGKPPEKPN